MGPFTVWIAAWRKSEGLPIPDAVAEKLAGDLFEGLQRLLVKRVEVPLGLRSAAEHLAADEIADLTERLLMPDRGLDAFVTNSRSLCWWMYCNAWRRVCQALTLRRAHGVTKLAVMADRQLDPKLLGQLEPGPPPGDALDVSRVPMETMELVELGLADLRRWEGRDWSWCFEQVCFEDRKQRQVAADLGVDETVVSLRLQQARFCITRRFGTPEKDLVAIYGATRAEAWSRALAKALRSTAG